MIHLLEQFKSIRAMLLIVPSNPSGTLLIEYFDDESVNKKIRGRKFKFVATTYTPPDTNVTGDVIIAYLIKNGKEQEQVMYFFNKDLEGDKFLIFRRPGSLIHSDKMCEYLLESLQCGIYYVRQSLPHKTPLQ